jgi:hypothetical protein
MTSVEALSDQVQSVELRVPWRTAKRRIVSVAVARHRRCVLAKVRLRRIEHVDALETDIRLMRGPYRQHRREEKGCKASLDLRRLHLRFGQDRSRDCSTLRKGRASAGLIFAGIIAGDIHPALAHHRQRPPRPGDQVSSWTK